jgi:hypothetical protein
MNSVKANAGPRMEDTYLRDPSGLQLLHTRPIQIVPLAATDQNLPPQPGYPKSKHAEGIRVARYRVIVEVALNDRLEPLPGYGHRFVHALPKLPFNFCQLPPHSLAYRVTLHRKVPVPVLPADMRESQKVECLGLPFSSLFPILLGKSPELDPARFIWV